MTDRKRDVRETFDAIADDFAATRREPWRAVERFVDDREGGDVALDLGCGNGRHLPVLAERFGRPVGVDVSRVLLGHVDEGRRLLGDLERLPLRTDVADVAVCVAALHHLPGRDRRLAALAEIGRVLAPDRRCLVSVWALDHPRFDGMRDEVRAQDGDVTVPWRSGEESHPRYYHIYEGGEFRDDVAAAPPAVEEVWTEEGNHYAVLRSTAGAGRP